MPRPAQAAAANFVEHLETLERDRADEVWLVVAGDPEDRSRETRHTYGQFAERVRAMAARLQQEADPGDRALIMLENDDHYAVAMLACFHAGVVAVPAFPPESTRPQHLARLAGIAADAGARIVVCMRAIAAGVRDSGVFGTALLIEADAVDARLSGAWRRHVPAEGDIAFLQYTSGSTSAPKGVMVSHGNLMANERAIQERMSIGPQDKFVCWSPLYHDMGLIGGLLQPLYRGIGLVLTSPRYFLERPSRWLELISRHRATISGGPDFAYRLCLERAKDSQLANLDLSSWRVAYTGAEPVRSDTMAAFSQKFSVAGFDAGAIYACFGLAEATLMATGGHRGAGMLARGYETASLERGRARHDVRGRSLVACGQAPEGHEIRIADPDGGALREAGQVGEIWLTGPSVAQGYWNNAEATRDAFVLHEGRRWLRTGDLGFQDEGELYVTGRIKDLIILRGHNLYPQDIEQAVELGVPAVRKGRVAAFAVEGPAGEGVGLAAEISRGMRKDWTADRLVRAMAEAASGVIAAPPSVVVLLNPGAMPKTSSGKLQRQACRQGWLAGSLDAYAVFENGEFRFGGEPQADAVAPQGAVEEALAGLWAEALDWPANRPPRRDMHFFVAGGNSLAAVRAAALIEAHWDLAFPLATLFESPRLVDCAARVQALLDAPRSPRRPALSASDADAPAQARNALSAAQERLWFMQVLQPHSTANHVALGLDIEGELDMGALRAALDALVARHEILRTAFVGDADGTPRAEVLAFAEARPRDVLLRDVADAGDAERMQAIQQAGQLNLRPFDLALAPLLRMALLRLEPARHRLVLVLHHLIADGHTINVLLGEMARLYAGAPEAPAPGQLQYRHYVAWQRRWLDDSARTAQRDYWTRRLGDAHPTLALSTDRPRLPTADYRPAECVRILPAAQVAALRAHAAKYDTTLPMVLLAALQVLLYRHTGLHDIRVGMPVAGRHVAGAALLPGLFVNTLVIDGSIGGQIGLDGVLEAVRAAAIGAHENQDLPFDELVQHLNPPRSLMHAPLFQVLFNHLQEDLREFEKLTGVRATPFHVAAATAQFELTVETRERPDGEVTVRLIYAEQLFAPQAMARFAEHYAAVLDAYAHAPRQRVREVVVLGEPERERLARWGAQPQALETGFTHHLIESQAARRGDAVALVYEGRAVSYADLNARANRLAHRLIGLGVGPDVTVGVALPRSV
ncbi:condensation domain-containing protein, partial [Achromobacter sp. Root83]|uniref:condensation domain-containing protein n=1 Tax=Achromobacter sp. Root83 TaxID=1736602 RepID=UPI0035198F4E